MLAVAAIGAGTASAQTPAVPAATVAAQPDDQSKVDPKDAAPSPKAEKPEVDKSGKPEDAKPKPEKPEPAQAVPKPEKPAPAQAVPKPEKPAPAQAVPKPEKPKPTPASPTPLQTKPAQTKPAQTKPAPTKSAPTKPAQTKPALTKPAATQPVEPKRAPAVAPSARPNDPGPKPQVDVAKPVSPRPKLAPSSTGSDAGRVTAAHRSAAEPNRNAARRRPSARGPVAVTPGRAPRLVSDGAAAGTAASPQRQEPRMLITGGPAGYNLWAPLLIALVFAAAVGRLFRRELRRGLGVAARPPAPGYRGARLRPARQRRTRVDRQLRRHLLRTRSGHARARRSARAPLLSLADNRQSRVALRATEHSRRR
jgi:hypothetical protein